MKRFGRLKALIAVLAVIVFLVGVYALTVNFYIIAASKKDIVTARQARDIENVDCVLVLGCGVKPDGTPSHMLSERLKTGAQVFENISGGKLLLSGDNSGDSYNELAVMERLSIENGVEKDSILIDNFGFSTYESIYNAKNTFNAKKIIIVTQSYHMPRALYIAKSLGLEAYGVTAWLPFYPKQIIWSAREVAARNKDFIKCMTDRP